MYEQETRLQMVLFGGVEEVVAVVGVEGVEGVGPVVGGRPGCWPPSRVVSTLIFSLFPCQSYLQTLMEEVGGQHRQTHRPHQLRGQGEEEPSYHCQ